MEGAWKLPQRRQRRLAELRGVGGEATGGLRRRIATSLHPTVQDATSRTPTAAGTPDIDEMGTPSRFDFSNVVYLWLVRGAFCSRSSRALGA